MSDHKHQPATFQYSCYLCEKATYERQRRACICRPRDPEGWYREDCPTHGREAQESRAEAGDARAANDAESLG